MRAVTKIPSYQSHLNIASLNVCKLRTKDEVVEIIRKEIAAADTTTDPLPWCIFIGWDIELIQELPTLSADYLDEHFSNEIPLMIIAQSGHAAWVNHKTFEICNITDETESPPGREYVKENGKLTGLILETPAIQSILDHYPKEHLLLKVDEAVEASKCSVEGLRSQGIHHCHRVGI